MAWNYTKILSLVTIEYKFFMASRLQSDCSKLLNTQCTVYS